MNLEESMPYIVGFIVWVIYAIGHSRGAKAERAKQDSLIRRLQIDKLGAKHED
ncbi:hypothetical protein [Aeromonas salmonicida]|uniref:hypothetical protein n=1 Tax=Aeromonas salmonicida TaxID=645 RepID=UPI003F7B7611